MKYKYFLCNKNNISQKININPFKIVFSICIYLRITFKYKNNDFSYCHKKIKKLRNKKEKTLKNNLKNCNRDELLSIAFDLQTIYRFVSYFFHQSDLCLNRSFALAYAYIYLGIPCHLIIGRSEYFLNRKYNFHSWVEIDGFPVNDSIGVLSQWRKIYII